MKKLILLVLLTLLFVPGPAYAVPLDVSVSPALITIRTDANEELTPIIYIQNKTTHNVSYDISLVPFQPSGLKNGEPELQDLVDNDYSSLFQNIIILNENAPVTRVDLAPLQKKAIKLGIDLPSTLKEKDYYFAVVFTSSAKERAENSTTITLNQALAVNVLLTFGRQSEPAGEIKDFIAPGFVDKGPLSFKINAKNTSNNYITAQGNILIKNMFGQSVGNLEIQPTNVLGSSERIIESPIWGEKFLLGFYSARAEIALSSSGPIITKEVNFFAFPLKYLLLAIISLLFISYLLFRLKKRQTEN